MYMLIHTFLFPFRLPFAKQNIFWSINVLKN